MSDTRIEAEWLRAPSLQSLLQALNAKGEEARIVGGAVRNTLMERPVTDIDIATTARPEETIRRVEAAGLKAVPTGIDHGTVTVVAPGAAYEVTTLRKDVETDGRHATVVFGRDWRADAERRDFTMNALYCEADGTVLDLVGGVADIRSRTLRFIGDAARRIEEDYLRILRFFRFFAWYGEGRPDAEGIRAATRLKDGLKQLSPERVWSELRKLLAAPDPSRALLWMRQTGTLAIVLPEGEKWGIDAIHGLSEAERALGWPADPLLRLEAILPPDPARMKALADRLRLSNADRDRLANWALADEPPAGEADGRLRLRLYFGDRMAIVDRLRLALARERAKTMEDRAALARVLGYARMLEVAENFTSPRFPVSGRDLKAAGVEAGPAMGETLRRLETAWAESGFVLGREALLEKI